MADSFGGGLAEGLNGLLSSLRSDRETKAKQNFADKLRLEDNATNAEISERVRKQRALEVFGRGLNEIKDQKVNGALTQLTGKAVKHSKATSKPLEGYQKQYDKLLNDIDTIKTRLSFGEAKANAKGSDNLNGLLADTKGKPDSDPNEPVLNLLKSKLLEKQQLESILKGGLAEQQDLQGDVESRAEALRNYSIDDAINTREARVLQLSLGLTDDDIAQFRVGSKPSGTNFEEILGVPFKSTLGVMPEQEMNLDKNLGIKDNPAKRAILSEKLNKAVANLPKDITSLQDLTTQDIQDIQSDPEFLAVLSQGFKQVQAIGGVVKDRTLKDQLGTPELQTYDNVLKLGGKLSPEQLNDLRSSNARDGATMTMHFLSDLGTPDTVGGISRLLEKKNIKGSQRQYDIGQNMNEANTGKNRYTGLPTPKYKWTEPKYQQLETDLKNNDMEVKTLSDLMLNLNDFKNTVIDPNKKYQYRPLDFGYLNK